MIRRHGKSTWLRVIIVAYVVWSSFFIFQTSYIAIDGNRYFNLFDDAMISMRYAWNFTHGKGLVWNEGEYIEGITNLLQTLHMSVWTALLDKSTAVLMVQIVGIVLMLGIASLTMKITKELFAAESLAHADFFSTVTFALPLAYYPLSYWSLTGMETGLLSILLVAATYLVLRTAQKPNRVARLIPILLGLAFLTRPDALLPSGIILLLHWYSDFKLMTRNALIREVIYDVAVVGLIVLATTVCRLFYYRSIIPNTYYLKAVGMPILDRLANGLGFTLAFAKQIIVPMLLVVAYLIARQRMKLLLLWLLPISLISYQIWIGGDAWPLWRIVASVFPIFFVLCLASLSYFIPIIRQRLNVSILRSAYAVQFTSLAIMVVLLIVLDRPFVREIVGASYPYDVPYSWHRIDEAVALNHIADPQATISETI